MSARAAMNTSARRSRRRRVLLGIVALAVVVAIPVGLIMQAQARIDMPAHRPDTDQAALLARGAYVARAADCVACHTAPGGQPFAGGLAFDTPFGKLYSTNITQDRSDGVGAFSDAELVGAIRNGISKDGRRLYPAMPYTSYTGMSDDDVTALVAYLHTIKPVASTPPPNTMGFPFNQRWAMAFWNVLNFDAGRQRPVAGKSADWNRGAYLVQTLEHCQECHSPRNLVQGLSGPALSGGNLGQWQAYNITSSTNSGIGGWSDAELAAYLKTGVTAGKANAAGPMAEAIEHSISHLSDGDIAAMVSYLRTVPAAENRGVTQPRYAYGEAVASASIDRLHNGGERYDPSSDALSGELLFNANCASCHAWSGHGVGSYPRLIGNTVLGADDARNVTAVILHGVHRTTEGHEAFMPGFDTLSDAQVAALGNYLFQQFGNPQTRLTAEDVRKAR